LETLIQYLKAPFTMTKNRKMKDSPMSRPTRPTSNPLKISHEPPPSQPGQSKDRLRKGAVAFPSRKASPWMAWFTIWRGRSSDMK
jgi:hypothetical protein